MEFEAETYPKRNGIKKVVCCKNNLIRVVNTTYNYTSVIK